MYLETTNSSATLERAGMRDIGLKMFTNFGYRFRFYDWDNISCFPRGRESLFIKTTIENRTDRLGEDFCIFV